VLPDRIDGIKATEGKLSVLSHDGTLAEVGADGKPAAQRVLVGDAYQKSVEGLRTPANPAAQTEAQQKAAPQRRVKFIAASGGLTAVAYWGGRVEVFDKEGNLQGGRSLPQDLTALAWWGDSLLAGDADGRLVALQVK
jgi:hypothetical protein